MSTVLDAVLGALSYIACSGPRKDTNVSISDGEVKVIRLKSRLTEAMPFSHSKRAMIYTEYVCVFESMLSPPNHPDSLMNDYFTCQVLICFCIVPHL